VQFASREGTISTAIAPFQLSSTMHSPCKLQVKGLEESSRARPESNLRLEQMLAQVKGIDVFYNYDEKSGFVGISSKKFAASRRGPERTASFKAVLSHNTHTYT